MRAAGAPHQPRLLLGFCEGRSHCSRCFHIGTACCCCCCTAAAERPSDAPSCSAECEGLPRPVPLASWPPFMAAGAAAAAQGFRYSRCRIAGAACAVRKCEKACGLRRWRAVGTGLRRGCAGTHGRWLQPKGLLVLTVCWVHCATWIAMWIERMRSVSRPSSLHHCSPVTAPSAAAQLL